MPKWANFDWIEKRTRKIKNTENEKPDDGRISKKSNFLMKGLPKNGKTTKDVTNLNF